MAAREGWQELTELEDVEVDELMRAPGVSDARVLSITVDDSIAVAEDFDWIAPLRVAADEGVEQTSDVIASNPAD